MLDGIVLVDKPAGKTSHDMVANARRRWRGLKVGHAGTLDPFATGLLIVLLGRATRAQSRFMELPKTYETVARLGHTSTTGDPEGEIEHTGRLPPDPIPLPTGTVMQRPPAHSAVKVGGRRAYSLARAGRRPELEARPVTVHRFEQRWRDAERAEFEIECSAGTYVRALIGDLGDAYCETLRRTAIGPFDVAEADSTRFVALHEALGRVLPVVELDADAARRAGHGEPVAGQAPDGATEVLLVDESGAIALAQPRDGALKPVVGFRG